MLWDDEQRQIAPALDTSGRDLPTTFGETFSAAWSRNTLFSQDYFGENDRMAALDDYLVKAKAMTGRDDIRPDTYTDPVTGNALTAQDLLRQTNEKVSALKQKNPALDLEPLSPEEFEANAVAKRRKADADYEAVMDRPRGPGATVGRWLGAGAAGVADPINLAALPIAPEAELGILASAVRWGEIGGAAGLVGTTLAAPYREQVQPGYIQSGAPELEIGEQAAFGALGGAAFPVARAVARPVINQLAGAWDRVRGLPWPTSVKDAGNIVSSEANINQSNIYSGIDGSAAHQQAFAKSTNDILAGRPVDVTQHITPELEARAEVPITTPPVTRPGELLLEPTSAQQQTEAQIRFMAWRAGYDMPTEEAVRISDRLAKATPDEAQKIMRDLQMSPRQVADAPTHIEPIPEPLPVLVSPIEDIHAPDLQAAVRADLDRELIAPQEGQYPTAVDVDGNISYQSIDKALNEVDGYKTAADQIAACASPAPEAEAA